MNLNDFFFVSVVLYIDFVGNQFYLLEREKMCANTNKID